MPLTPALSHKREGEQCNVPQHPAWHANRMTAQRLTLLLTALLAAACSTPAPKATPVAAEAPAVTTVETPATTPGAFADNPIVYFVVTDRFENGNSGNDNSYGRKRGASPREDVGTFHGGDLKGLTNKLEQGWFKELGVNALWITAPYEQIHGWVVGGNKEFKHYAYHGYYALDYTVLDRNMGTPEELREMVDTAHAQGIRVLFDVVMNHPGYLDYHSFIDYNNFAFADWWGRDWVRAGLPGYIDGGRDDLTSQLAYLPDFRTESIEAVKLPKFLRNKPDTKAVELPDTTVRGYLVKWLTDWVRVYGIDGFRADTVKHVEPAAWAELKAEASNALSEWKARNPGKKIDDAPFWMVGEYWGHGPERGKLHDAGFDAMINFDFQERGGQYAHPEKLFAEYARLQAGKPAQMLNYISSHDTELFDRTRLIEAGAALLLAPGAAQIYYGDETAQPAGPVPNSDPQQATRSDMNWASPDAAVLAHWRKLGSFRARHVALVRGEHRKLGDAPYTFARTDRASGDAVVVAMGTAGAAGIPVGNVFPEGLAVQDACSGATGTVRNGSVVLQGTGRYVLLKRAAAKP